MTINLNDPAQRWRGAIEHWQRGNDAPLVELLHDDVPRTPEAIAFLVEVVTGTAKRKRGRPERKLRDTLAERGPILAEYLRLRDQGNKKEVILRLLSEQFGMPESTISTIIYPRGK